MNLRSALVCAVASVLVLAGCSKDPEAAKRDYLKSGDEYIKTGKVQEAILQYRNALQQDPRSGEARLKLSKAYETAGDARNSYAEAIRAADLLPKSLEAQTRAATFLVASRQFEDARTRAQKALAIDPHNVQALIIDGYAKAGLKDFGAAFKQLQQAIDLAPASGSSYLPMAQVQLATGKRDEAEATFKKAIEAEPKSADARTALAFFYWSTGRQAEAEQEFKQLIEVSPDSKLGHQALATFYIATGRGAEAEPHLKWAADKKDPAARLRLADYYLAMKRNDDGVKMLVDIAANGKAADVVEAQLRLAAIWYTQGDHDRAHRTIDLILKNDPMHVRALTLKSRFLTAEHKIDEALDRANAAVRADPRDLPAHFVLAEAYQRKGDYEAALKEFRDILSRNPQAVVAQVRIAQLELVRGKTAESVQAAESALHAAPNSPEVQLVLARSLTASGDLDRADQLLKDLSAKYRAAVVEAQRGQLLLRRRDVPGARRAFEDAMKLDANSFDALAGLVTVDIVEGKAAAARTRVQSRVDASPDNTQLRLLAARTYAATGAVPEAETALLKVIESDPSLIEAYGMLAQLYVREQKIDMALAQFNEVAKRDPKSVSARTAVGILLQTQNKNAEARKKYEEVLQIDQRAAVAANNLAWMYAESGEKLDDALKLAQAAREQLPESADVTDTLGYVFLKKQMASLAVEPLQASVQKDAANPVYHYHLGLAFMQTGHLADAEQQFKEALKSGANFPGADDARKQLTALQ